MSKEKLLLVGAGGFGRMVAEQAMLNTIALLWMMDNLLER